MDGKIKNGEDFYKVQFFFVVSTLFLIGILLKKDIKQSTLIIYLFIKQLHTFKYNTITS